jgi:hypothetical protein
MITISSYMFKNDNHIILHIHCAVISRTLCYVRDVAYVLSHYSTYALCTQATNSVWHVYSLMVARKLDAIVMETGHERVNDHRAVYDTIMYMPNKCLITGVHSSHNSRFIKNGNILVNQPSNRSKHFRNIWIWKPLTCVFIQCCHAMLHQHS